MKVSELPPLFQPATLPPALMKLYAALARAGNDGRRRQAALHIIHAYFRLYGPTGMQPLMWQLLAGTMGKKAGKKAGKRQKLLFFYETTLMLIDAARVIHDITKEDG